jgi:Ureidoglycolate hydrolase
MNPILRARPLTSAAFAPFGDAIDCHDARHFPINDGWAERYHDLAALDLTGAAGRPAISIVHSRARPEPLTLAVMERHRLGSQAFVPLANCVFLIVVAPPGKPPAAASDLTAFVSDGRQGVNYRAGTWHHPLLVIGQAGDFLVIDRIGPEVDCEEVDISGWEIRLEV